MYDCIFIKIRKYVMFLICIASIRNIDKIVERFASIINVQGLIGNIMTVRSRRKNIVKDTMDLLLNHNNFLRKNYQPSRDKYLESYGVNKKISNFRCRPGQNCN